MLQGGAYTGIGAIGAEPYGKLPLKNPCIRPWFKYMRYQVKHIDGRNLISFSGVCKYYAPSPP